MSSTNANILIRRFGNSLGNIAISLSYLFPVKFERPKFLFKAWKTKLSYGIVATEDKAINPDIERNMYHYAGTKIIDIKGSHFLFISQPAAVANVIIAAANDLITNQLK